MPNPRRARARAIAEAFLAGAWSTRSLAERAGRVIGVKPRPRWVAKVAAAMVARFPEPPAARRDELVRAILDHPSFQPLPTRARDLSPWRMGPSRFDVPALPTVGDLAAWLGVDVGVLEWLADPRNLGRAAPGPLRHYTCTWARKRTAGWRLLEAPKHRLKSAQRRVLDGILASVPPHDAAHGFRPGRSVLTAAAPHVGRVVVLHMDLEDFFVSVTRARVRAVFRAVGYPVGAAAILAGLCTHAVPPDVRAAVPRVGPADRDAQLHHLRRLAVPHLPQGAPSSPALANLVAWGLDVRLAAAAAAVGATYTRYADDLFFSGEADFDRRVRAFVPLVAAIAAEEGFRANLHKTRIMRQGGAQRVTGIVVNRRPNVSRAEVDRLRAILHRCLHAGPSTQNREQHADLRAHLAGRVAWVTQVNPARGARLRALLDRIDWTR